MTPQIPRTLSALMLVIAATVVSAQERPSVFEKINETPALRGFDRDDFEILEAMVPMRDGVRLYTLIARPKVHDEPLPILLEHTPYDATSALTGTEWYGGRRSPSLAATLGRWSATLVEDGYVFVFQDVRGKAGSEGSYRVYPPLRDLVNPAQVDTSTDIHDTIGWLVRHVPNNNGRVGIWGTSYPGRTALESLLLPHPALRAVVPFNPVVDLWMGDDYYHQGAFRLGYNTEFIWAQTLETWTSFPYRGRDAYQWYMNAGPAAAFGDRWFERTLPTWEEAIAHPAYDAYWQAQALDKPLASIGAGAAAVLNVHAWFDQEDSYGAPAAYRALESRDTGKRNFFVAGPWFHAQWLFDGDSLGAIRWGSDTAHHFREEILVPFLRRHLKSDDTAKPLPEAYTFDTGAKVWRSHPAWPPRDAQRTRVYLRAGGVLSLSPPIAEERSASEFVSDPHRPVPFRASVFDTVSGGEGWQHWLTEDQRPIARRPDVLTFVTEPLEESMTAVGAVNAVLHATTSGSDADWVVKLIDVYPDEYPRQPELGGYQLMVAADILRGRYREGFDVPRAIVPGKAEAYRIALPEVHHTFRRGHRIAVQIQSTWFPLYDRNPQVFVPNIHFADANTFAAATHRILHAADAASHVELMTLPGRPR